MLRLVAATLGLTGVAMGAFGTHALDGRLGVEAQGWWDTASFYLLVHAALAVAVSVAARDGHVRMAGWAMTLGALIFAGTLYAMALGAPRWLGAVTPLGGLGMMVGWGLLAASGLRTR